MGGGARRGARRRGGGGVAGARRSASRRCVARVERRSPKDCARTYTLARAHAHRTAHASRIANFIFFRGARTGRGRTANRRGRTGGSRGADSPHRPRRRRAYPARARGRSRRRRQDAQPSGRCHAPRVRYVLSSGTHVVAREGLTCPNAPGPRGGANGSGASPAFLSMACHPRHSCSRSRPSGARRLMWTAYGR